MKLAFETFSSSFLNNRLLQALWMLGVSQTIKTNIWSVNCSDPGSAEKLVRYGSCAEQNNASSWTKISSCLLVAPIRQHWTWQATLAYRCLFSPASLDGQIVDVEICYLHSLNRGSGPWFPYQIAVMRFTPLPCPAIVFVRSRTTGDLWWMGVSPLQDFAYVIRLLDSCVIYLRQSQNASYFSMQFSDYVLRLKLSENSCEFFFL